MGFPVKHILFNQAAFGALSHALKREHVEIITFPDYFGEGPHTQYDIRHSGEVSPEQMKRMLKLNVLEPLTEDQLALLQAEAVQLMEGHSIVRTWIRGRIIEDDESRDDQEIIRYASDMQYKYGSHDFFNAARLIGHVLGWSEHDINDTWIDYRLRMLIKKGIFESIGHLREMRSYQIRLNTSQDE